MPISRRSALVGLAAAGAAASSVSCQQSSATSTLTSTLTELAVPEPATDLLLNRSRAVDVMAARGVDLLLCSDPVNVFYLTNHRTVASMLGMDGLAYASFRASGQHAPALITGKFSYYLSSDDITVPDLVDLKLFTTPAEPDLYGELSTADQIMSAPASEGYITPVFDIAKPRPFETLRRANIAAASTAVAASAEAALLRELRDADLPNSTVGVDDPRLIPMLQRSGLDIRFVDGERILREIRLQKSPAELSFARYAASANAAAGLAAARMVSAGASFQELRTSFSIQCGERRTTPVYILIDGVVAPLSREGIVPGRSFLIDCVSSFEGYHGDYGRTVCVGEPTARMQKVVDALGFVWDRLLPELKPGVSYAEIWSLGQRLFSETRVDAGLVLGPHAVGLHHTDEPSGVEFGPFEKQNLVLQDSMLLSVDMPVLGSGLGGTAHLEDLVLISKDGPELLNPASDRFIVA